ncbi:NAD(P)-dependent dehydrogenase (short-subunit alcohol dehydrogenase family) [Rhodococcus sp. PvR044]|jgi:NAD(P)-dependent dehydrogenase (short-subunit alcohol dehydrogenase family)|uniref:SDR family NAD(P)-dependent oxidoreductase n=1 Tax=Rhodococcus TaxID=1827 RepID=UPI000BD80959|nr:MULTISPECIES: SDR family NAD(P)-dependent oxidoreductase [Rhodococcus]MBP1161947.1 NAD(P)-dependent dehydrogenase (short-subunit alcohol dehydrogenase family) [Rhodococcus sp. PvR099]MCZ4557709.1 SDR family NAD(P)-dependent oxidoreductase [Rhodococcus maanshanensis]PTR43343.1 short-subunit dehydrogenase [Rhodococcus sp. OK611]SNX91206.1 Short-chain dehydrogenase [Rhodococcus sp. OK270]
MTQQGATLGSASTTDEVLDGVDLNGRTVLVTGVTSGLGAETARALAGAGAHVVLTARDTAAAGSVATRIRQAHPSSEPEVFGLDLADLESVRALVDRVSERRLAVDILINNAGVMYTPFERTRDGFELQFGTNHLGHFTLTTALLPSLSAAADRSGVPARVITVSSDAHRAHPVDLVDPNFESRTYDKFVAYAQSKAANVLMTVELERRVGGQGVHAFAVHPGVCATGLARHMSSGDMAEMKRMSAGSPNALTNLKSVPAAAATSVWGATAPELDSVGGAYLADCVVGAAADHATDPATAAALWELSDELTAPSARQP